MSASSSGSSGSIAFGSILICLSSPEPVAVTVTANGAGEIKQIKIDPKAIDPDDPELLADMVLAAVNEALRSAKSLADAKLGGLAGGALGGLGLPGF